MLLREHIIYNKKLTSLLIFPYEAFHFKWGCQPRSFLPPPLQVSMLAWLLLFLPPVSWAQRSEPVFSAITRSVLPPDHENNPTQLNYGVAVTDVDGDGDLEMFVAG